MQVPRSLVGTSVQFRTPPWVPHPPPEPCRQAPPPGAVWAVGEAPQTQDLSQASGVGQDTHTTLNLEALPRCTLRGLTMCIHMVSDAITMCAHNVHTLPVHSAHTVQRRGSGCERIVHLPEGLPYPPCASTHCAVGCAHNSCVGGPHTYWAGKGSSENLCKHTCTHTCGVHGEHTK